MHASEFYHDVFCLCWPPPPPFFFFCLAWNSHATIPLHMFPLTAPSQAGDFGQPDILFQYLITFESHLHQRTGLQFYIHPLFLQREYSLFFVGREGEYLLPIRCWSIKRRCSPLTCIPWSIHLPPPWIAILASILTAPAHMVYISGRGLWLYRWLEMHIRPEQLLYEFENLSPTVV